MPDNSGPDLLARFRTLPIAAALLSRLNGVDGVYLVGGAVRDLLLGRPPAELDLAIEAEICDLARSIGGAGSVHDRFGTATTELEGVRIDLARCRRERYPFPGALPEVEPAGLEEDLERRDFTVNAMALGLRGSRAGELVVVRCAQDDLAGGRLRVLHGASFRDDPTRLLRLVRYLVRLGFAVEAETAGLANEALRDGALGWISGARLGSELRLLAAEEDRVGAFVALGDFGVAEAIEPGFGLADPARARRAEHLLAAAGRPSSLVLGLALEGVDAAERARFADRLGFTARERQVLLAVAAQARPLAKALERARRPSEIAALARGLPAELLAAAGALGPERQVRNWLESLRHVQTEIGGADLLRAGIAPGPEIGRGLAAALAAKLDGRAVSREQELSAALAAHPGGGEPRRPGGGLE